LYHLASTVHLESRVAIQQMELYLRHCGMRKKLKLQLVTIHVVHITMRVGYENTIGLMYIS